MPLCYIHSGLLQSKHLALIKAFCFPPLPLTSFSPSRLLLTAAVAAVLVSISVCLFLNPFLYSSFFPPPNSLLPVIHSLRPPKVASSPSSFTSCLLLPSPPSGTVLLHAASWWAAFGVSFCSCVWIWDGYGLRNRKQTTPGETTMLGKQMSILCRWINPMQVTGWEYDHRWVFCRFNKKSNLGHASVQL